MGKTNGRDTMRDNILDSAKSVINNRGNEYGPVEENWKRTANILNGILDKKLKEPLSPADVGMIMIGVKMARLCNTPEHRDTQIDIAGYSALLSEVV